MFDEPNASKMEHASDDLALLRALERKVLWLSTYLIHNANHLRDKRDGLKVGGHQASCASMNTLMTALYFHILQENDRVAVKPHASPVFHAIQYLMGRQSLDNLKNFRALGGAQSYPSRTKDAPPVDFSTGSVGLGAAATLFASIVQDYNISHELMDPSKAGRMIALIGDAELDEGNIYEALLDGWKHKVRNLSWIIDYNRQSLDGVVNDELFRKIEGVFDSLGWRVTTLKYGAKLEAIRHQPGGEAILNWIDNCPNQMYSALTYQGGSAWRKNLRTDIGDASGVAGLLDENDDNALHALMTNLGGHDLQSIIDCFAAIEDDPSPQCIIAYTVKGFGLPLAGHKDNHAGLMTPAQLAEFQGVMGVPEGEEWSVFGGMQELEGPLTEFIQKAPQTHRAESRNETPRIATPPLAAPTAKRQSTQDAFGKILFELAKSDEPLAERIVTTSPDVTVSTNLGGWVNRRKLYERDVRADIFKREKIPSTQLWERAPGGQHLELGIAENNLFLLLGQLGLSADMFGARLIPVGALYDPFINRGLDAMNYACYQDGRFLLVATPSGLTLAPEGGAHQSIHPPVIGMAQPGMTYFEPSYADELAAIMQWSFDHLQADDGGSVYLRLSTRPLDQPTRALQPENVIDGAYWFATPPIEAKVVIAFAGALAPEAIAAYEQLNADNVPTALLSVTSPDRIHAAWTASQRAEINDGRTRPSHIERLLSEVATNARIITLIDGAPQTLSWLGGVCGHRVVSLGVEKFGQSGDLPDLFHTHRLDTAAIVDAATNAFLP